MELFDTHCHVHELVEKLTPVYDKWREDGVERDPDEVIQRAHDAGVTRILCIGTSVEDSELAIEFAANRDGVWASIGIHPHEAQHHLSKNPKSQFSFLLEVKPLRRKKIVAVGECGLDYFYDHSPREAQIEVLKFQIELALKHDLPLSFHVREAYDDFWLIFEQYQGIRGVLHSFTDSQANLQRALGHGLYIGLNGIATFTKSEAQLDMYRAIPLDKLVLETDAPFLTPTPYRGKICEPYHIRVIAEFAANLRGESLENLAAATTANAQNLFGI